ncbi:hypothetical protein M231_05201 [Tremella mesenterica]|uniref:Uncharacterized protein n=1 Tax=Tremella mesenterica TaxID=5217 RepID=A0A4Q1BIL8_TREME|nr:hypothetical protein M231_05201 [Tremella mesenterica]
MPALTFLIGTGIRAGIGIIKSGVQAHKDFNNPDGPQVRYDKKGRVKEPGAVYGLFMKAEHKLSNKGKGKEEGQTDDEPVASGSTQSIPTSDNNVTPGPQPRFNKSDSLRDDYGSQSNAVETNRDLTPQPGEAPPSYGEVMYLPPSNPPPNPRSSSAMAMPKEKSRTLQPNATNASEGSTSIRPPNNRRGSSSDSDSGNSSEEMRNDPMARGLSKHDYRRLRRDLKMQRKMMGRDERRANKREMKAQRAQMKADRAFGRAQGL